MYETYISSDILGLQKAQIFVLGDVILDTYIEGSVSRISPEAPVPVVLEKAQRHVPGGAGNVAANIAAMGGQVWLCGRIGADDSGKKMRSILQHHQVSDQYLIESLRLPTLNKIRILSGNQYSLGAQQLIRIDQETIMATDETEERQALAVLERFLQLPGPKAVVISDYGKGLLTKSLLHKVIAYSTAAKVPIVTDPKSEDVERYQGSTVIKPNLSEGRLLFRVKSPGQVFTDVAEEIQAVSACYLKYSGSRNLVMSLSEHGVLAVGIDAPESLHFETKALQVADVSGAGDTLVAFLAMGLATDLSLERATYLGNIAAGIVCGKLGTATVTPSEILDALKRFEESKTAEEKIFVLEQMVSLVADLKQRHKRVVFTNGCFDILHAGHVDYLQKAKRQGDVLIVGLNTDASIARLKGPQRPVQPLADRAFILSALACVDFIVPFDEDTPLQAILALQPHVLVKGADYTVENTVGAKEVLGWGGEVQHIELLPGRSTTQLLQSAWAKMSCQG